MTRNNWHGDGSNYDLHPVVLDTGLQLMSYATYHDIRTAYKQCIPSTISHLLDLI